MFWTRQGASIMAAVLASVVTALAGSSWRAATAGTKYRSEFCATRTMNS
jgi:hypothetical protein